MVEIEKPLNGQVQRFLNDFRCLKDSGHWVMPDRLRAEMNGTSTFYLPHNDLGVN
jgi:hypothetical protein